MRRRVEGDLGFVAIGFRFVLGTTFLLAGLAKLPRRVEFMGAVRMYGVLPDAWVPTIARLIPPVEIALGTLTLAIGLGIALIPAARASAASSHCCPDSGCQSQCQQGFFGYSCFDQCANKTCCSCLSTNPGCHDVPCGACG